VNEALLELKFECRVGVIVKNRNLIFHLQRPNSIEGVDPELLTEFHAEEHAEGREVRRHPANVLVVRLLLGRIIPTTPLEKTQPTLVLRAQVALVAGVLFVVEP